MGCGARGSGSCQGTVRTFREAWGFITDTLGRDVFVHIKDCIDGGLPQAGDVLTFDVEENPQKPGALKAKNVSGGSGVPDSSGKGMGKGGGGYGPMYGGGGGGCNFGGGCGFPGGGGAYAGGGGAYGGGGPYSGGC